MDKEEEETLSTALSRMEELLEMKDVELTTLHGKLDRYETKDRLAENEDRWAWTEHVIMEEDDIVGLPIPRLELQWESLDDYHYQTRCWYYLVFKHLCGETIKVPLGLTRSTGRLEAEFHPDAKGGPQITVPFRDGAHATNESRQLKLPAYVIWGSKAQELLPHEKGPGFERGPLLNVKSEE